MDLLGKVRKIWQGHPGPLFVSDQRSLTFDEILDSTPVNLDAVEKGAVVALIGDFDPVSIATLLRLVDLGAIVVPLSRETRSDHEYFFDVAHVDFVIEGLQLSRRHEARTHPLIDTLRARGHAGLVLFSTGTTGRPKGILHDFTLFLRRFDTPRPTLRTLSFLLFDHIGGINTLLHTLFNRGVVIVPAARTVDAVLSACAKYGAEVLPATPTFLRMTLMSGAIPDRIPGTLRVITYGTERMDQVTLDEIARLLPSVDLRQTFGMSELGIVRVKSEARDSLFMKIGGEGVETKVVDSVLHIRSDSRMMGYLNADSPFDEAGWYNTNDVVEQKGDCIKVVGRTTEIINAGGLKFMASEVERVALGFPGISLATVHARSNPITGQHAEITVQPVDAANFDKAAFSAYLHQHLQAHMVPRRISLQDVAVGHRFKRL